MYLFLGVLKGCSDKKVKKKNPELVAEGFAREGVFRCV